jgi:hypothetical protein
MEKKKEKERKESKVLKEKKKNYVLQHSVLLLNVAARCS